MQVLDVTIDIRGRWFDRRLGRIADPTQRDELLAADLTACLLALDPNAAPAPQVLLVAFPRSYPSYLHDDANRPHTEPTLFDRIGHLASKAKHFPPDAAEQHAHYLDDTRRRVPHAR